MPMLTSRGPLATASWERIGPGAQSGPLAYLRLPDAANPELEQAGLDPIFYYIPAEPKVEDDPAGDPNFSLTLLLDREPGEGFPTESIGGGVLSLGLSLDAAAPPIEPELEYRPLFVRKLELQLARTSMRDTARDRVDFAGSANRGALSAELGPDEAREVLAALDGAGGEGLRVRAVLHYRAAAEPAGVRLSASWSQVHDNIAGRVGEEGVIEVAELRRCFHELAGDGTISIEPADSNAIPDEEAIFRSFLSLSSPILEKSPAGLSDVTTFRLRPRPDEIFRLDFRLRTDAARMDSIEVVTPVSTLLDGLLRDRPRERFIRIVSPRSGSGTLAPPPRTMRARRRRDRWTGGGGQAVSLVAGSPGLMSISQALRPGSAHTSGPHSTLPYLSAAAAIGGAGVRQAWLDDLLIEQARGEKREHLPVVEDPNAAIWRDRIDGNRYWYAPVFEVVQPEPAAHPATSPFLMEIERTGTTASGRPALRVEVRFTLRRRQSDATRAALSALARGRGEPVPLGDLSVSLLVPFVDDADGRVKSHRFECDLEEEGDLFIARVTMLNDWGRLCYGSLAEPDFQPEPARVQIAFSFQAYVTVVRKDVELAGGGKLAHTKVLYTAKEGAGPLKGAFFDARNARYHGEDRELRFTREAGYGERTAAAAGSSSRAVVGLATSTTVVAAASVATSSPQPAAVGRPQLAPSTALAEYFRRPRFAMRRLARAERRELLFPCRTLGSLYREITGSGDAAIGCRDVLKLGRTTYRQYEEIEDLASPRYRVFRSLQQPGRFLVLPARYRLTRYEPGEGERGYRPVLVVYAALAERPEDNRVVFSATLQPDLPLHERRLLAERLAELALAPVVEYPTEIESEAEFSWTVDAGLAVEATTLVAPEGLQTSLAADTSGALLLKSMLETGGIAGRATFSQPDGTSLGTNLELALDRIVGPWSAGPLESVRRSGTLTLMNRIERTVRVDDVLLYESGTKVGREPVEAELAPGESLPLSPNTPFDEAVPIYTTVGVGGVTIEEVRTFVEDVMTNVIFLDLINYENHELAHLAVRTRLKDVPGTYPVAFSGEPPVGVVEMNLPLTTYLERQIVEFQVTKTFQSGTREDTRWIEWDMETQGNVIGLLWDALT